MAKLNDPKVSEDNKVKLQKIMETCREQLTTLSNAGKEKVHRAPPSAEAYAKAMEAEQERLAKLQAEQKNAFTLNNTLVNNGAEGADRPSVNGGAAVAADKTEQYKQPEGCLDFKIEIATELEVAKRPFDGLEKFDATNTVNILNTCLKQYNDAHGTGEIEKTVTNEDGTTSTEKHAETIQDLLLEDGLWMDNNALGIQLRGKDAALAGKMFSAMTQSENLFNLYWMPNAKDPA